MFNNKTSGRKIPLVDEMKIKVTSKERATIDSIESIVECL